LPAKPSVEPSKETSISRPILSHLNRRTPTKSISTAERDRQSAYNKETLRNAALTPTTPYKALPLGQAVHHPNTTHFDDPATAGPHPKPSNAAHLCFFLTFPRHPVFRSMRPCESARPLRDVGRASDSQDRMDQRDSTIKARAG